VEPTAIIFSVIGVGQKAVRTVKLSNEGTGALQIDALTLDPSGDKGFVILSPPKLPLTLQIQESVTVSIQFAPTKAGQPRSQLWIDSNDPKTNRTKVPIRTVGNAPRIQVKPSLVNFGFVDPGKRVSRKVTISNIGSADLNISRLEISSVSKDFALVLNGKNVQNSTSQKTLAPGKSWEVTLSYGPSGPGGSLGELRIHNDTKETPVAKVILQGRRSEPDIHVSPRQLDFGGVPVKKSRTLTLVISNRGGVELQVTKITLDAGVPEFRAAFPSLPLKIAPGQSSAIAVFYTPQKEGINRSRIWLESNDPDTPKLPVILTGQSPPSGLNVRPLVLNFGGVPAGASKTLALQVYNTGTKPVTVNSVPITQQGSEFSVASQALPKTLQPNDVLIFNVTYSPKSGNKHTGTLTVKSNDPGRPEIPVALEGSVIPAPPCFLKANPSTVSFSQVKLGKSQQQSVKVTNIGSGTCWLFEVKLSANSGLDLGISSGTLVLPKTLGQGQSHNIQVSFTPRKAGPVQGNVEVVHGTGLLNRLAPLQIPVTAIGAGPRLCIVPSWLDFGGVSVGSSKNDSFQLRSCGTEPLKLTSMKKTAVTSGEYSITTPPTLPLTLAVGKTISVTVQYKPTAQGYDPGQIELVSNSAGSNKQYVDLKGFGLTGPQSCGALRGRICAPDGNTWLSGARVWIKLSNGKIVEGKTDLDGYYYLPCVDAGQHKVYVQKGSFSTDFNVSVVKGKTNNQTTPVCVDASRTKIAVIDGEYDKIQNILDRLKLTYTFYSQKGGKDPERLLKSLSAMKKYNIIFLNCGIDESFLNSTVANNLRQFVKGGGSIYASDFSYDFIEVAWPNAMDWAGNDQTRNAAEKVSGATITAKVLSTLLQKRLGGRTQIPLKFDLCPCAAADAAGTGTNVLMTGDRQKNGNPKQPLAIQFRPEPKGGNVIYTTFHNEEQSSRTIDIILRTLIFEL
jgi:hypothetical protein